MNAPSGGGQPGQPGHPGQVQTPQMAGNLQRMPSLYRPEQMRTIMLLNDDEKQKYERGLAQLWTLHDNSAQGSQERSDALRKLYDFGKMLQNKMQARKQQIQQQQMMQGQGATPNMNMASQPGAGGVDGSASNGSSSNATPATNAGASANGANNAQQLKQIPPNIAQHVESLVINVPANVTDKAKYVADTKANYTRALLSLENAKAGIKRLDDIARDRQAKGNPLRPEEQSVFDQRRTNLQKQQSDMYSYLTNMRKEVVQQQQPPQQRTGQPNQGGLPQQPGNPQGNGSGGEAGDGSGQTNTMHSSTVAVNAAIAAARNQQAAAGLAQNANGGPGQQLPGHAQLPQANSQNLQALPSPGLQHHHHQQQQQAAPPQQQVPVKIEPGSQSQLPPQINTAMAQNNGAGMPATGTPTQNRVPTPQATPTSAVPPSIMPSNQPRPLTHAAANNLANTRGGTLTGGTPSAIGVMGAPSYSHAHPHTASQTITTSKLISKALPENATRVPTPVPTMTGIPSARPTYSGGSGIAGGVMAQPAMAKIPAYSLDGEGERVLSKKKLDELVRQVCGGTGEGQEGNMLAPEVEESVLNLADSFVDNVLHASCRLAKERGSKILEIRDIQMILERVYNIRIPGYSSDELRTVRKMQPSPAWITKMSAVQAAKVMPGKGEL